MTLRATQAMQRWAKAKEVMGWPHRAEQDWGFAQAAVRVWVVREDVSAVRTDLMLAAHLLSENPACELAPPRPSSAVDQSAPIPQRSLFRSKAPAKDPPAGRRSPRSRPKA